ncbi:MAG: UDP-glucose 4-epimerase GalE [Phycisphaerae bacterium]|nr:UDP-glucose 4-epimerase GalE [Phycisphaerae bacterium]
MENHSPRDVLVTGGAGYIGSHAALELLRTGHRVRIIDTLERGSIDTIRRLQAIGEVDFIQGDCGDELLLQEVLRGIDTIMHFAAFTRVDESMACPELYQQQNVEVTKSLAESAAAHGIGQFIFSSTCAVYGTPDEDHLPVSEAAPLNPENTYGDTKARAESILRRISQNHDSLNLGILRYFNVVGVDAKGVLQEPVVAARLTSACLQTALGNQSEFTLHGTDYDTSDGTAVRDFVHVSDIARAHLALMDSLQPAIVSVYNVGCGHGTSVLQIVRAIEQICGHSIPVIEGPRRPGDIPAIWADSSRIQSELGWSPHYTSIMDMLATSWQNAMK